MDHQHEHTGQEFGLPEEPAQDSYQDAAEHKLAKCNNVLVRKYGIPRLAGVCALLGIAVYGTASVVRTVRPTGNRPPTNTAAYVDGEIRTLAAATEYFWKADPNSRMPSPDDTEALIAYTANGPVELSIKYKNGGVAGLDVQTKGGELQFTETSKGWNSSYTFGPPGAEENTRTIDGEEIVFRRDGSPATSIASRQEATGLLDSQVNMAAGYINAAAAACGLSPILLLPRT